MRAVLPLVFCWLVVCGCAAPYVNAPDYRPPAATSDSSGDQLDDLAGTAPVADIEPGRTVTLADCVRIALATNRRIRIADRQVELARADEGIASAAYWPTLHAAGTYQTTIRNLDGSPFDFLTGSVTLAAPIYTFGKLEHGLETARAGTRAAGYSAERTRQLLTVQVRFAYFDVLEAWRTKEVTEESIEAIDEQLRAARSREEAGVGKRADVLAVEVQLAERKTELEVARTRVVVSLARFNRLLGVDVLSPTQLLDVTDDPELPAADFTLLLQAALANRPDLRALAAGIDATRAGYRQTRSDLLPTVSGVAEYSVNSAQNDPIVNPTSDQFFLALQLEIPLFNMGTYAELSRRQLEIADAVDRHAEAVDDLVLELTEVLASVRDAVERIPVARSAIALAEENLRLAREEFRAGTRNSTDVLVEEDRLNQSRLTYYRALYDYRRALAALESVIAADPSTLAATD